MPLPRSWGFSLFALATVATIHVAMGATPSFGPNVMVFDPSMPLSQIQAAVDAIANQQISNQFGTQRFALLFLPGTYGTSATPLNFQVGYYTEVAGLGASPNDVVINGSINVYNQCFGADNCIALDNFWRSLSNLTINVTTPNAGCYSGNFWAVSQASPMRRVNINGPLTLMDYCTSPSYASGGFIADSEFHRNVINGSQQQFFVRNSVLNGWSNGVWNQVFSGVTGAPANCFPANSSCGGPYTTLPESPVTRERPFLYADSSGQYNVFVPAVSTNSAGTSWASGTTTGSSIPLSKFFIATPATPPLQINLALLLGQNLILTPGIYNYSIPLVVTRPDTVVIGLGFATLSPTNGLPAMLVADVPGVKIAGLIFDAGPVNSPVLLQVGTPFLRQGNAQDPTTLSDVFFRIGGAAVGKATNSLVVYTDNVILDDIWAWRADHGSGVGWTSNTADTGLIVNGNNVTAYGLFVEHYQKYEVIWNGENGQTIMFQNEMPYDPPDQPSWMHNGVDGYAAYKVADSVHTHQAWGMGSYDFFTSPNPVHSANAFEVPTGAGIALHDIFDLDLSSSGELGGILNVVDNTGGPSQLDTPNPIVSFP